MTDLRLEFLQLIDLQLENRLNDGDSQRLLEILDADPSFVHLYAEYMTLHGQLFWDAGLSASTMVPVELDIPATVAASVCTSCGDSAHSDSDQVMAPQRAGRRLTQSGILLATTLLILLGFRVWFAPQGQQPVVVQNKPAPAVPQMQSADRLPVGTRKSGDHEADLKPIELARTPTEALEQDSQPTTAASIDQKERAPKQQFTDQMIIAKIDQHLKAVWDDHEIQSSPKASDSEWVRRAYLTFAGRVPSLDETEAFLAERSADKRLRLVREVAAGAEQASHLAMIWTNLLVGRTARRGVNREKLFDFLYEQFDRNLPWIDTVNELITASGRNDQNGATNFLLAHLNNEATPATAVTARLFLGEQLSCVQCHDHPFSGQSKQQDYWALNAFFKDTNRVSAEVATTDSERRMSDMPWKLVDRPQPDRMTYYENRAGLKKAVLPTYDGKTLAPDSQENRRKQLAGLLAADSRSRVARSMVNRMWNHFFGFGFTNPVDDMGPHATVSHPELLDFLTSAFVDSNYDVQRLMTWIASSKAWQLSSDPNSSNAVDAPATGELPLFSRIYVRRMTPEQVYESIRVAIRSAAGHPINSPEVHSQHRRNWVRQFAQAYNTDENDESLDFEGTISQALVMMNGDEVDMAIHQATEAILNRSGRQSASSLDSLRLVALAMVHREPTSQEEAAFRQHLKRLSVRQPSTAVSTAVEDMMWAYLNSSEFVLVR